MSNTIIAPTTEKINPGVKRAELDATFARIAALLPDAGYVLLRRPGEQYPKWDRKTKQYVTTTATGKEPIAKNWQNQPATLEQAKAHAMRGGNVGLAGGYGGYVLVDLDRLADERKTHQLLTGTAAVLRRNAADRGKWIVRIEGELPRSAKNGTAGVEVLAAGNQGVIFGTHHTGARIEIAGETIRLCHADDVAELWKEFVGSDLAGDTAHEIGEPDADAVKRSMALVETVLTLGNVAGDWREYGDGRKIILDHCPFNPPDNPHADDEAAAVIIQHDGTIGATCHHARCQERIQAHGSGWGLLKQLVGYVPPENDVKRIVDNIRLWYRSVDLAEFVPILKQSENGYRTRANDTKTIEVFCQLMTEQNRFDVTASYRTIATKMACSVGSVKARLDRVLGWFVVPLETDAGAMTYALAASFGEMVEDWAAEYTEVAYIEHLFPWRNIGVQCTQLCISTHTADPAFAYSLTPLTVQQVQNRWDDSIDDANVKPYARTEQLKRRLAADLPSLGADALLVVDALQRHGGTLEKRRLAELTFKSKSAISRIVGRLVDLELADADHYTVALHGDWTAHLAGIVGRMPTTPGVVERDVKYAEEIIARIDFDVRNGILDAEQAAPRWKRANKRLTRALRRRAEMELPTVSDSLLAAIDDITYTPERKTVRIDERQKRLQAAFIAEKHAEQRQVATDRRHLIAEIQRLRSDGVSKYDAAQILETASWLPAEIWGAMKTAWPKAVAA